jgi:hypothetical protein
MEGERRRTNEWRQAKVGGSEGRHCAAPYIDFDPILMALVVLPRFSSVRLPEVFDNLEVHRTVVAALGAQQLWGDGSADVQ